MMPSRYFISSKAGVTLAELSVSLAIIALIIATSFGGVTILKAAKIRKIATEFTTYMSAISEFEKQYSYLPGDLPNASSYWTGAHNGNGDGLVPAGTEDLYVWEHLSDAKLVAGYFTGLYSDNPTNSVKWAIGTNCPGSEAIPTGAFNFYQAGSYIYNTTGNALRLSTIAAGVDGGSVMPAKDAYSIDIKIDDGLPSSGMLYTLRIATNCTDAAYNASSANYNLSDTTVDCRLFYWQKKF